jgi:hypothetical protein
MDNDLCFLLFVTRNFIILILIIASHYIVDLLDSSVQVWPGYTSGVQRPIPIQCERMVVTTVALVNARICLRAAMPAREVVVRAIAFAG